MKLVKIDGENYDLDQMSAEAKAQLLSVQAADAKLNELRRDTALTLTARNAYMQSLKKELGSPTSSEDSSVATKSSGKRK
jgi:hypothetical protein